MIVAILQNEDPDSSKKWRLACEKFGVPYKVIDFTKNGWLEEIQREKFDFFLLRPSGKFEHFKTLYDERLYVLSKILKKQTYPAYEEVLIYENKRMLNCFLKGSGIPHPKTWVFYHMDEALVFILKSHYPLVAKTQIGASGTGVEFLRNETQAKKYLRNAFSYKGIRRRFGPNRVTGTPKKWFKKALTNHRYFFKKLEEYISIYKDSQKGFVLLQEYIPHNFEWRAVKIGESYFAHKKIKHKDKASGSKGIDYVNPPTKLLNFIKKSCEEHNFNFMAFDLFEDQNGGYLVNELQTIFGHVQDHILEVDGKPGRYLFQGGKWMFEEGDFNTNESYDLRLKTAIELYNQNTI